MKTEFKQLHDGGVYLLTPEIFHDGRGTFIEAHKLLDFMKITGHDTIFVQSNISHSHPYVLRGMHFQHGQCGKLVRCMYGKIFQVSVDAREGPTFGSWVGQVLDSESQQAVYVPPGFANGFTAFENGAAVHYEMTDYYNPKLERAFAWNDPAVGIKWPFGPGASVRMSGKDKNAPPLAEVGPWRDI